MEPRRNTVSLALLALAALVPAPSLGVFFAMIFEPTRGTAVGQGIYFFSKVWILILPILWLKWIDRERMSLSPARRGGFVTGALLGGVIGAIIVAAYFLFGRELIDVDQMRDAAQRNGIGSIHAYLGLAIYLTLVNSLLEEYVWRWFVFRKCEVLLGGGAAVVLSALMFTLHHVFALAAQTSWLTTIVASFGIFVGGCTWSWCYLRYRSIWPGYVSHLIVDAAVFLVGWRILFNEEIITKATAPAL
jgi:membrane protease YdiL (CAAX protease family)